MKYLFRTAWGLMALMSLFIAGFTVIYFNFQPDTFFLQTKPIPLVHDPVWRTAFYIHITSSMICLAIGPFQFLKKFRNRFLSLHRSMGKAYIVCILFLGGPTGLYMAFFANGGFWTSLGFFLLSLVWWFTTWKAYTAIRQKKIQKHRQWMIRSFALCFSAVTLRMIWMPFLSKVLELDHQFVLHITAFLNWIPNLVVAELLIRLSQKETARR